MLSVVLLAGGSSSRFKPLKEKNLYPFLGKTLIERQLEKLSSFKGIDEIVVVANESNIDEISEYIRSINSSAKVIVQEGAGQAGAVNTALNVIGNDGDILVVNMNDLFEDSLIEEFFKLLPKLQERNECMLVGYKVNEYFPGGYLVLDGDYVTKVVEKPGAGNEPSEYVRIVFDYFTSRAELKKTLEETLSEKDDVYEVALSNMMNKGVKFYMFGFEGIWKTIKYPWHVLSVTKYLLSTIKGQSVAKDAVISNTAIINGNVVIESGVRIFDNAVINGPAYIGKNTVVGNNVLIRSSIIGDDCVIGFASEIARSYLKSNISLHMNYIGDSIIEDNVSLGSSTLTANFRLDHKTIKVNIKGEKVVTGLQKLGAIIGSNTSLGSRVTIMPGIKIASGCMVGAGVVLDEDVDEGKFIKLSQDIEVRDNNVI